MKISADDIRRQKFEIGFRGYSTQEVDTFLQLLADDYETSIKDNDRFTKEAAELRKKVDEYRKKEEFLEKAMINAQRSAEETMEEAKKEAEKIRREAEISSEKAVGRAEIKAMEIKDEIYELQKQKTQLITQIKVMLENIQKYIDSEKVYESVQPSQERKTEDNQIEKEESLSDNNKINLENVLSDPESKLLESSETAMQDIDLENNPDIVTTTEE